MNKLAGDVNRWTSYAATPNATTHDNRHWDQIYSFFFYHCHARGLLSHTPLFRTFIDSLGNKKKKRTEAFRQSGRFTFVGIVVGETKFNPGFMLVSA